MRRPLRLLMVLTLFSGFSWRDCAGEAGGQTAAMPVMVIAPLGGNKAEVPGWQPAIGQGISEMLIESLEGSDNKFQVLDTVETTGPQNGSGPGGSNSAGGQAKPATGGSAGSQRPAKGEAPGPAQPAPAGPPSSGNSEAGGTAGSDFMFCGDVTEFTMQTNSSRIGDFVSSSPFANLGGKVITARVEIVWRVVDTETKRVIRRGIAACSASGSEFEMPSLASTSEQAPKGGSATAPAKPAVPAKAATPAKAAPGGTGGSGNGGKSGNNNLALANNFLSGLNKAFSNTPNGEGGGDSANDTSGATAKPAKMPAKKPAQAAAEGGGDAGGADSETYGYGNPGFMNSALGKATRKAVTNIIEQLATISLPEPARVARSKSAGDALKHAPGKILAVAGRDTIIVSLGSKEGFKEGDQLELYQPTDVKDDKGNVVFTDEKLVGEITLSAVQEERSRGSYSGDAQVQQGWPVKAR